MSEPEVSGAGAVVRALLTAWDDADFDAAAALLSEDFAATAHTDGSVITRERYVAAHRLLHDAFPDLEHHIVELTELAAEQVRVVADVTATNDRPVQLPELGIDLPHPTGRTFTTVPHTDEFVVRDGLVVGYESHQPPGAGLKGLLEQIRAAQIDEVTGADEEKGADE